MVRFRIRTNWTNCVSMTHEFTLDDLADGAVRDKLKWAMSEPDRPRPGETRQTVTERAAATFADLAQGLRDRGYDPETVAHFVNRVVSRMFAEDVGLLPDDMFTRARRHHLLPAASSGTPEKRQLDTRVVSVPDGASRQNEMQWRGSPTPRSADL